MRYQVTRVYQDCTGKTETTDSIVSAFSAAAIYMEDPDCIGIIIVDTKTDMIVTNYWAA